MNGRSALIVIVALCLVLGLGWWRMAPPVSDDGALADQAPIENPEASSPPTPQERPAPPMPLVGVPLRDALPSLRARADAGDGKAACRLGMELLRCREVARFSLEEEERIEEALQSRPKGRDDAMADAMAQRLSLHRGVRAACAGLRPDLEAQAGRYLRIAALAGEPEALYRYAAGEGFNQREGYGFILTPEFDQWRREARGLMDRALAGGDPQAALALYDAHASDVGLFAGLTAGEASEAHAYAGLVHNLYGDSLTPMSGWLGLTELPPLSVDEAALAAARAATWHQDYFGGRQFDLIDMALDYELLPVDGTAAEVLARDLCPGRETPDHD